MQKYFSYIYQKVEFDISCKLSCQVHSSFAMPFPCSISCKFPPKETVCMECHSLFVENFRQICHQTADDILKCFNYYSTFAEWTLLP